MQIGIVVRGLDATLRRYAGEYGIDPWNLFDGTPADRSPITGEHLAARVGV